MAENSQQSLTVRLLSTPAAAMTPVTVTSSNPAVANVVGEVTIPAGAQVATLTLRGRQAGEAMLTLRAGTAVRQLTVVVGPPSAGRVPPILAAPVGMAIRPAGTAGTLFMGVGGSRDIVLQLLSAPLSADVQVLASSANPQVADITPGFFVLPAGQQSAVFTVNTGGSDAEAVITLQIGAEVRTLLAVVGIPGNERIPLTLAPIVGVEVGE